MREKVLIIISLVVLGLILFFGAKKPIGPIKIMSSDELKSLLDQKRKVFVLDVREKNEYDEEHIPDAIHFPKSKFDKNDSEILKTLSGIKKTDKIVTYCGSGHRSGWVAKSLQGLGYRNVENLDGLSFWTKKYQTVKGPKEKNVEPNRIHTDEAYFNFQNFKDISWADVRDTGEYNAGHIQGAISIPLTELESRLSEFPKDKDIILYCSGTFGGGSCSASLSAARILINHGFAFGKIKVYEDGYGTWAEKGLPTEK